MASIESHDAGLAARCWAMAVSNTPRSCAVVVLLSPARYALPSSTPRSTTIESAPSARAVALARFASTRSTSTSVARLDDTVSIRSEEHTSELQSRLHLVCRLLLEKKKTMCTH